MKAEKPTVDPDDLRMPADEFDGIMREVFRKPQAGKPEPREPIRRRKPAPKRGRRQRKR